VLLSHHSPFKVAEDFSVLAGLFPGRIDLGIGRAAGTDPETDRLLRRHRSEAPPDDYEEQLEELLDTLQRRFGQDGRWVGQGAVKAHGEPEAWLLGSSGKSASIAARRGLPYCFADFINSGGAGIAASYREGYVPHAGRERPRIAVAVRAIAAETEREARRLAASWRMAYDLVWTQRPILVPAPEPAMRYLRSRGIDPDRDPVPLVGTPDRVRVELEEVAAAYGAEEVIVVTVTHSHRARRRSYELLAAEFGLDAALDAVHSQQS
jgi:luciferase family oxidoreductase group 1